MIISPLNTSSPEGREKIAAINDRFQMSDHSCREAVAAIIKDVIDRGDEAVLEYTRKFDCPDLTLSGLKVSQNEIDQAAGHIEPELLNSIRLARDRIRTFHERELEDSWLITREDGVITGRLVRPVASAGLYVPGGRGGCTPLISSVLMNGIPAGIAGVEKRIMVTPPDRQGKVHPALLAAAREIGITEIYKTGSAWAIAALAFGTGSIPKAEVIVGPGNKFVAEAKQQVRGRVGIDMIAGPSEVLIVADHRANPAFIAADMLAQAEHDPQALSILLTTSPEVARETGEELERQLKTLSRSEIAGESLSQKGAILIAGDLEEAIELANDIAAEHLELMLEDPWGSLPKVRNAGAIFLGDYCPEAFGDYVAGPNHVLPTMGTARISSALGVETFLKKSSLISCSRKAFLNDAPHIKILAGQEGLTAHSRSAEIRTEGTDNTGDQ